LGSRGVGIQRKNSSNSNCSNNSRSGAGKVSYFNALKEARSFNKSVNEDLENKVKKKSLNVRLKKSSTLKVILVGKHKHPGH
jgi:hypothetical protein